MEDNYLNLLFNTTSYKDFLKLAIRENRHIKAYRTRLAEGAGCQRTFLSHVLHTHVEFTIEQAHSLARFWKMNEEQTDYFVTLVLYSRAGTPPLRKYFLEKIERIRTKKTEVERAILKGEPPSSVDSTETTYYCEWQYAALHLMISVPSLQSVSALSSRLGETEEKVLARLKELERLGFAREQNGKWRRTEKDLHVGRSSPLYALHHINWRTRSLPALLNEPESLHFTGIHSLSKDDVKKIKELLLGFLSTSQSIVKDSREEEVVCINLDLFTV